MAAKKNAQVAPAEAEVTQTTEAPVTETTPEEGEVTHEDHDITEYEAETLTTVPEVEGELEYEDTDSNYDVSVSYDTDDINMDVPETDSGLLMISGDDALKLKELTQRIVQQNGGMVRLPGGTQRHTINFDATSYNALQDLLTLLKTVFV